MYIVKLALCVLSGFALSIGVAMAQAEQGDGEQSQAAPAQTTAPFQVPHVNVLSKMVQSHMAALSNAIVTNNFSVLRALGTPQFQNTNSAEKLAQTFSAFRENRLDITRVIIFRPVLKEKPRVDENGKLILKGFYQTTPSRVVFDLAFFPAAGKWKLDAISVHVQPPEQKQPTARNNIVERTIVSSINMRAAPALQGELLKTLQPGEKVKVLGQVPGTEWHSVLLAPETVGFIKTSVLQDNSR